MGRSVRSHQHRSVRREQPEGQLAVEEGEGVVVVVVELDSKREGSKEHKLRDKGPALKLAWERGMG